MAVLAPLSPLSLHLWLASCTLPFSCAGLHPLTLPAAGLHCLCILLCEMLVPHILCGPLQMKGSPHLAYGLPSALLRKLQSKTAHVLILGWRVHAVWWRAGHLTALSPQPLPTKGDSNTTPTSWGLTEDWIIGPHEVLRAAPGTQFPSVSIREAVISLCTPLPFYYHTIIITLVMIVS